MARPRQPVEVIQARGAKHLTKAEIQERKASEVKPLDGEIVAPAYLTKKQTETFYKISEQLQKLKIMGETDVESLGRYITANDFYINAVKKMRSKAVRDNPELFDTWSKVQDRYFKQCRAAANDLGLTISSRCRLVVPEKQTEPPKENKFKKFEKRSAVGE
jgi:P27 family predicted phage terminase small subunit